MNVPLTADTFADNTAKARREALESIFRFVRNNPARHGPEYNNADREYEADRREWEWRTR